MKYYRPLNSDESNLFVIRCSVDLTRTTQSVDINNPTQNKVIVGGTNINVDDGYNALISPNRFNLPEYFAIIMQQQMNPSFDPLNVNRNSDETSNGTIWIQYGSQFVSAPSISIVPNYTEDNTAINYIKRDTKVGLRTFNSNPTLDTCQAKIMFYNRFGSKHYFDSNSGLTGFDLIIIGPVRSGISTQHTNKGWSMVSGNDPREIYTRMNVNCLAPLNSFFHRSNLPYYGLNEHHNITPNQMLSDIIIYSPSLRIEATVPTGPELANGIQDIKQYSIKINDCFNLVINNLSTNGIANVHLLEAQGITIIGNNVVHYRDDANNAVSVGTANFRIICSNDTADNEEFQMVRVG